LLSRGVGSGKSTALRYVSAGLHPSEYRPIPITATPGSILELYRLILTELRIEKTSASRAVLTRLIQKEIRELYEGKKIKPVLIIDEASLLRLEVFAELHTLTQFDQDSKPISPSSWPVKVLWWINSFSVLLIPWLLVSWPAVT
jgi:general secretion pathway protein A